jgi:hypothetical protein
VKWQYDKKLESNGNEWYPTVGSRSFYTFISGHQSESEGIKSWIEREAQSWKEKRSLCEATYGHTKKEKMLNGNERYQTVAWRCFRHLLWERKLSMNEFLVEEKVRHNQAKRREGTKEEDMEI